MLGCNGTHRTWSAQRWKSSAARQLAASFLMAMWFLMMISSVALAYYFYLKSERLERELRNLRQQVGLPAQPESGTIKTVVIPEGVPPEAFEETTGSAPLSEKNLASTHEPAAEEGEATPVPTPTSSPKRSGSLAPEGGAPQASEAASTPLASSQTPEPSRSSQAPAEAPSPSPSLRATPRSSRIGSVYDIPSESPRR